MLVLKGADVNGRDNDGFTPLSYGSVNLEKETCELLISKGGKVNLHWAVMKGDKEAVLSLINGTDLKTGPMGYTPLHVAVSMGNRDMAELLISKGSNVNARTDKGDTLCFMPYVQAKGILLNYL